MCTGTTEGLRSEDHAWAPAYCFRSEYGVVGEFLPIARSVACSLQAPGCRTGPDFVIRQDRMLFVERRNGLSLV